MVFLALWQHWPARLLAVAIPAVLCLWSIIGHHSAAGQANSAEQSDIPKFVNVIDASGITHEQVRGPDELFAMPATLVGGVILFDYDGDGLLDIYLLQGNDLTPGKMDPRITNRLYRNLGNWRFQDVTDSAGVGVFGYFLGGAAADYDNDGAVDLYVCNHGPNVLFSNHGDGTFGSVTDSALAGNEMTSTASFCDFDGDGDLDLYVVNYVNWSYETNPQCLVKEVRRYCGPRQYQATPDRLFHNAGAGSFVEATKGSGIEAPNGTGLGIVTADFNNDGRPDVFIANDVNQNFLLRNLGNMKFEEEGLVMGVALNGLGEMQSNMGVACGDFDQNGWLDVFVTHFVKETNTLWANRGEVGFDDVTAAAGLAHASLVRMGWGTHFLDYDRDGWLDLVIANGHIELAPESGGGKGQKAQLFHNVRGKFKEVSDLAGPYFQQDWVGRGLAIGDLDNDGDTDVVINHQHGKPALLRNDTQASGHWLQLHLVGTRSNRDALNTRVIVHEKGKSRIHEVFGGGSFGAASDIRPLLGLGPQTEVEELEIRWQSGLIQHFKGLQGDAAYRLVEGRPDAVKINGAASGR